METACKIVIHETAEASGELMGNKITEKILNPKPVPEMNSRNVEEIVIPPEKRQEILNELKKKIKKKLRKKFNTTQYLTYETIQLYQSL